VLGVEVVEALQRARQFEPRIHNLAMLESFVHKLDNEFTDVLREAVFDLAEHGQYKFQPE
jgi:hypothetical protein